ncbi:unnamed protein product [Ilex paraguariensis]|uniref:Transmembrane protein n=1 Tax=Ilex paraguariensis TaxID=185542 RepID=A0ABC8UZI0_9AQUA
MFVSPLVPSITPLYVYSRRSRLLTPDFVPPPTSLFSSNSATSIPFDTLPIDLHNCTRSCITHHPIGHFVSSRSVSSLFSCFTTQSSSMSIPKIVTTALFDLRWWHAMEKRCKHFMTIILGILFCCLLVSRLLAVAGSKLLNFIWMVPWIVSKLT